MALFSATEASRDQKGLASPSFIAKLVNRRHRKLRRLVCSVNYDLKGGQSTRGKC
jgi:hypothetical protein